MEPARSLDTVTKHSLTRDGCKIMRFVTYAGGRRDGPELVDDVPGQVVDVVVRQRHPRVTDALADKMVQLGVVQPDRTLK